MADPPRYRDTSADDAGLPRWVKVLGIVVAVLILLALAVMLIPGGGLGGHGPGRHG